jgi:flagellar biosynthesis/type III secretory pathway chaperone
MDDIITMANVLEDLLVNEFRTCQTIQHLTNEERQALARYDIPSLALLVEQKEAMLDELGQIEDKRRMVVQNLSQVFGIESSSPSIAEIATRLHLDTGNRINRLREGIMALAEDIRVLTSGNHTLVMTALDRVDAMQTFFLDTFKPALFYDRPGTTPLNQPDAVWDVDQRI